MNDGANVSLESDLGQKLISTYKLPTVEHNELYLIQHDSGEFREHQHLSNEANNKGVIFSKQWIREQNGVALSPRNVTLQTFIRHHIHHPENNTMRAIPYTEVN